MVLIVFFNSKISPLTFTVIFFDRSPLATAVVTAAMLRTCEVRLEAIEFTESVKSFHVPETPSTFAWPPSFPSVPTSRATRVTSEAKAPSCSTIAFTVLAVRKNSPFSGCPSISLAIVSDRFPLATAPMTRAISLVGRSRSSIKTLMHPMASPQDSDTSLNAARCVIRPSFPTTRTIRPNSCVMR